MSKNQQSGSIANSRMLKNDKENPITKQQTRKSINEGMLMFKLAKQHNIGKCRTPKCNNSHRNSISLANKPFQYAFDDFLKPDPKVSMKISRGPSFNMHPLLSKHAEQSSSLSDGSKQAELLKEIRDTLNSLVEKQKADSKQLRELKDEVSALNQRTTDIMDEFREFQIQSKNNAR